MMNTTLKELQECMDRAVKNMESATKQKDKEFFLSEYYRLKAKYDKEMETYLNWLLNY